MATKTFKIGLSNADKAAMAQDIYERLIGMSFDEYDSSKTYNKGDFVVYESPADTFKLYECNSDNVTGAWDSSKWDLATFQTLVDNIEDAVAFVNDKANVDGNYPTMTVGAADNLTPYDAESGTDQKQPFLFQGTGCGNGEQQVDTGALALLKEKQGHSVVVNQVVQSGTTEKTIDHDTSPYEVSWDIGIHLQVGHKYLCFVNAKTSVDNQLIYIGVTDSVVDTKVDIFYSKTSYETIYFIATITSTLTGNNFVFLRFTDPSTQSGSLYGKNANVIDLTQWFGSNDNIPAHLLSHPEDFFRYYQGSLAYNTGTLVNSNGRYLKTIGRNQWDEVMESGDISTITGNNADNPSNVRSKNYIPVIPNETYYLKSSNDGFHLYFYDRDKSFISHTLCSSNTTFTIPSNACYLRFVPYTDYGTTYKHDICISIYYEDESGYDQYYPYEELANIDTGTETLRSAGSVKDSKAPDGTITRRVGYVDLGSLTWTYNAGGQNEFGAEIPLGKINTSSVNNPNAVCSMFYRASQNTGYAGLENMQFAFADRNYSATCCITVKDSSYTDAATFKTAMSGVYLFYELATPTTEQGTAFSENVQINDFGSMEFAAANGVPTGASLFYAVDYKAFVDSLYNTLDGDATDIVKDSALDTKLAALGYVKLTSVTGYDATKTQVLKNVEGTLTWVTEE